jgi:hypothetical protein
MKSFSVRARTLVLASCACFASATCTDFVVTPDKPRTNAQLFDELWTTVDRHYSFFQLKRLNWDSIGAVYRQYAIKATDKGSLQAAFATLLRELHDPHVELYEDYGPYPILPYQGRADTIRTNFDPTIVINRYFAADFPVADFVRSAMISSSVGYLRIDNFLGAADEITKLDTAMKSVSTASSLIVDVRTNNGGSYPLAIEMAGRFVQRSETFGYLQFRNGPAHSDLTALIPEVVKPTGPPKADIRIYLLTNAATASSAEVFVLALRTNVKVVVVGDTTAGMSGGPTARELSNGWVYRISEWVEYTPNRETYESIGLPPDALVRTRESDSTRRIDPVVSRALQLAAAASATTVNQAGLASVTTNPSRPTR